MSSLRYKLHVFHNDFLVVFSFTFLCICHPKGSCAGITPFLWNVSVRCNDKFRFSADMVCDTLAQCWGRTATRNLRGGEQHRRQAAAPWPASGVHRPWTGRFNSIRAFWVRYVCTSTSTPKKVYHEQLNDANIMTFSDSTGKLISVQRRTIRFFFVRISMHSMWISRHPGVCRWKYGWNTTLTFTANFKGQPCPGDETVPGI